MKILIPTSKQLTSDIGDFSELNFCKKTEYIIEILNKLDIEQLKNVYKISFEQAKTEKENWENLKSKKARVFEAINMFDGLMYRNIKRKDLSNKEKKYIKENIFITSSLYGIVNSYDKISKHRLDFLQNIKINNTSLKLFWREKFDDFIENNDNVISLLSSEFEDVFSKNQKDKLIKISFFEDKNGNLKSHSTISKKGRGKLLTSIIINQVKDINKIPSLEFDGFLFNDSLSTDKDIVFVKKYNYI